MAKSRDTATSWAVLGVVTFSLFLEVGLVKSFSVLLPDIKEQFETYTWVVGSPVSIIIGWGSIAGLFASPLVNRFGPRLSLIMCGSLSSMGLIICLCAPNPLVLLLGLILAGSLVVQEIIALGVLPSYFDKYYNTAVAISTCGSGFGIIVMPIVTQIFLDIYGWRGTLVLLSGLCLHTIPCGTVLFDSFTEHQAHKKHTNCQGETCETEKSAYEFCFSLVIELSSVFCNPLLTRRSFIAQIFIPAIVWGYTFTGWLIYIVSFSLSNGTSMREASIVGTCGGIGLTAIRALLPLFHKVFTYKQLMCISSIISAISLALTNIFNTFLGICLMSVIFGAGFGILGAELYIAMKEITKENEYFLCVAYANMIHGFAAIASGFFTGWLFDMTGSFIASFGLLAGISLLTTISIGLEEVWNAFQSRCNSAPI